jgi:hypothetical protein
MRLSMGRLWMSAFLLAACAEPTPQDAARARDGVVERAEAQPDTIPDLIQPRVPTAVLGDSGWSYSQRVTADLDNDGTDESLVLLSDVHLDKSGQPLWEDGHRWQVYVQEPDSGITRLYARFIPNGKLVAELTSDIGPSPSIVLLEQAADHLAVYEVRYRGPRRVEVFKRLERTLDPERSLSGSPRP